MSNISCSGLMDASVKIRVMKARENIKCAKGLR